MDSSTAAAWTQAILSGIAIIFASFLAVMVPYWERRAAAKRESAARLEVVTKRWEPAGLRFDIHYYPEFTHVGMKARVSLLSPSNGILKEGRPTHSPAVMIIDGSHTRYDLGSTFVDRIGQVRLLPTEDDSALLLKGVFFVAPDEHAEQSLHQADINIEIVTDAGVRLLRHRMTISALN